MDKTEARIKLAIDAMGSDLGPSEVLEGVAQAERSFSPEY